MAATTVQSRLSSEAKVPFGPEVRNFIAESIKCQTLFANCEGCYRRKINMHQEKEVLKDFIYNTMYYQEFHTQATDFEANDKDEAEAFVANICEKMMSLSQKFNLKDQIHFSVIWVYYFDYEKRKGLSVPVFKIFKTISGNEAVFLDVSLKTYESWDCYSETAEYPESLLCYPRHGDYRFDSKANLSLEFVRPGKLTTARMWGFDALLKKPFCQVAIRPLLSLMSEPWFREKLEKIKPLVNAFCSFIRGLRGTELNLTVFALLVGIKLKELGGLEAFSMKSVADLAFMLLNFVIDARNPCQFLSVNFWSDFKLTSCPSLSSFSEVQTAAFAFHSEGANLFKLLKSPQKDWSEILKKFSSLYRKSSVILNAIISFTPDSSVTKLLFTLLKVAEGLASWVSTLESPGTENSGSEAAKDLVKIETGMTPCLMPLISPSTTEKRSPDTENSVACFRQIFGEKILSDLPLLETYSTIQIRDRIFSEVPELLKKCTLDPSLGRFGVLLGTVDGYEIHLFFKASLPQLFSVFRRLLNIDFCIKANSTESCFDLIDMFGKKLGTLFFPLEFTAIGLFPIGTFGHIENTYTRGEGFLGLFNLGEPRIAPTQREYSRIGPQDFGDSIGEFSGGSDS